MDFQAQLEQDRANLITNLQNMQRDWDELGRRIQQQAGGVQYCDMLLKRIAEERNGGEPTPPGV